MLTGMFAPTEGYATVAGKDIRTDMDGIRQEIGICLQHDCLFPELTVWEHVDFFARIKGMHARMSAREAREKVDGSIQDVALTEKRNTLSKNLSGGMKRKLSVAIAFCGDSKTVILDEPTSGMVSLNTTHVRLNLFTSCDLIPHTLLTQRTRSREGSLGTSFASIVKTGASSLQHILW
jgi:ABC-type multidrug transport system ATPase subunit